MIFQENSYLTQIINTYNHNSKYLVNYDERKKYAGQVAESYIDAIINARHQKNQKMSWTREGAHLCCKSEPA